MIDINKLRRLAQAATPGPWHATKSVETNSWAVWSDTTRLMELRPTKTVDMYLVSNTAAFIAAANPAAISELLDRLEAAESDGLEQARLNGMGGEREAALLSKLEAAEKERDALRAELEKERKEHSYTLHAAEAEAKQVDRLRAKVESMEKQEPVATTAATHKPGEVGYCTFHKETPFGSTLYALPGAKGD